MAEQQEDVLDGLCARMGVALTDAQRGGIEGFVTRLLLWNARINLTGARSRAELVGEHLCDSLAMAQLVPEGARVIDVGAGGGLPAIPFAVLRPDAELTLVEPRQKRAAFLRTAVREGGLSRVRVEAVRLEAIAPAQDFDVASSRATFPPIEWLSAARGYVRPGGKVLVFAARRAEVADAAEWVLSDERAYTTASGHARWVGAFVPRGTPTGDVPRGTFPVG